MRLGLLNRMTGSGENMDAEHLKGDGCKPPSDGRRGAAGKAASRALVVG
jgi:hypothetical protein